MAFPTNNIYRFLIKILPQYKYYLRERNVYSVSKNLTQIRDLSVSCKLCNEFLQPFESTCSNLLVENINQETQRWMCKRIDSTDSRTLPHTDKVTAFNRLMLVHCFELFLLKEGPLLKAESSFCDCEIVLPAICSIIDAADKYNIDSFVIGFSQLKMLSVLSQILNVTTEKLFMSIVNCRNSVTISDIMSYMDTNCTSPIKTWLVGSTNIPQALCPLSLGITKALQEHHTKPDKVWPILCYCANDIVDKNIFSNIVQLSNDVRYSMNGAIHIVINETDEDMSLKHESQCKFVKIFADFIKAPIVHVRAEDVDYVVNVMQFAADFKATYNRHIVIDLVNGVSQSIPIVKKLTLPGLVKQMMTSERLPLVASYLHDLVINKVIGDIGYNLKRNETLKGLQMYHTKQSVLDDVSNIMRSKSSQEISKESDTWTSLNVLHDIGKRLVQIPNNGDIKIDSATLQVLDDRKQEIESNKLSWTTCQLMAQQSLIQEGINVHISCSKKCPITNFYPLEVDKSSGYGAYSVNRSLVCGYSTAGFELGYSSAVDGKWLNIWIGPKDIQPNLINTILHDYLACATKELSTNITFIIPSYTYVLDKNHKTYYSTKCKQTHNLLECIDGDSYCDTRVEVVDLSSPANLYHVLKRQAKGNIRRPLIVFIPSDQQLRTTHFSTMEELAENSKFEPLIDDTTSSDKKVEHLLLCSGVVAHDLKNELRRQKLEDTIGLTRIERIHPLPIGGITDLMKRMEPKNIWWIQEEYMDDGWWNYVQSRLMKEDIHVNYGGIPKECSQSSYKEPNNSSSIISNIIDNVLSKT